MHDRWKKKADQLRVQFVLHRDEFRVLILKVDDNEKSSLVLRTIANGAICQGVAVAPSRVDTDTAVEYFRTPAST